MDTLISSFNTSRDLLELEAKIGYYDKNNIFRSEVPRRLFNRFLDRMRSYVDGKLPIPENLSFIGLKQDPNSRKRVSSEVTLYKGNIRAIFTPVNNELIYQKKDRIYDFEDMAYGIRFSLSKEYQVPAERATEQTGMRSRVRDSFLLNEFVLDMTEVKSVYNGKPYLSYEVEIEYIGNKPATNLLNKLNTTVAVIYMALKGTDNIYTIQDQGIITNFLSDMKVDRDSLVQARNLKKKDFKYGGIVGNPNYSFYVTYKADGQRYLLVVHETGIWLVFLPFDFNLVFPMDDNIRSLFKDFMGSVFDGEKLESRYFIFDCLIGNKKDYRFFNYIERMSLAIKLTQSIPRNNVLNFELKETRHVTDPTTIFYLLREMFANRKSLDYPEDGLMFTPSGRYNPGSDKLPYKKRVLSKVPDIVKFKDAKDITIDFYVVKGLDGLLELQVFDERLKRNVKFEGTNINPMRPELIDQDHEMTRDVNGVVVEYEFIDNKLRPRKLRTDKAGPNNLGVAEANWTDVNNPLTEQDLMGYTNTFVFSYHNDIKRSIFDLIRSFNCKTLLDIGTGFGGDVPKMHGLQVIGVEPNQNNLQELLSRLKVYNFESNMIVLNMGGEDPRVHETVNKNFGLVDAVTMMLSLSFFWKNKEMLNGLVNNIVKSLKPGGVFAFLTIDGDSAMELFNLRSEFNLNGAEFKLNPDRSVSVNMPGTIVGVQTEYLVFMDDLTMRLAEHGINLVEYRKASHEPVLPTASKLFSNMYSFGYYVRDGKVSRKIVSQEDEAREYSNMIRNILNQPTISTSMATGNSILPTRTSMDSRRESILPSRTSVSVERQSILPSRTSITGNTLATSNQVINNQFSNMISREDPRNFNFPDYRRPGLQVELPQVIPGLVLSRPNINLRENQNKGGGEYGGYNSLPGEQNVPGLNNNYVARISNEPFDLRQVRFN